MRRLMIVLAAAGLLAACEDSKRPASPEGAEAAWKSAGLEVTDLAPTEVAALGDAACRAGTADGVHVTLCELADAEAARKAEAKGLKLVGNKTGASLAQGKLLLVVADADGKDPNGKVINTLTKTFRKLDPKAAEEASEEASAKPATEDVEPTGKAAPP